VHKVCLEAFELGKFEVTQRQWRQVMIHNPDPSQFEDERGPVESVDWNEARWFIFLMNSLGRQHYRLPSEAEWEYAARAGTSTARYWGDRVDDGCIYENMADLAVKKIAPDSVVANCDDGEAYTAPVGSFKPNPWGLTTCSATSQNGSRIAMSETIRKRQRTAERLQFRIAKAASLAAVPGTIFRETSARRTASTIHRTTRARPPASGLSEQFLLESLPLSFFKRSEWEGTGVIADVRNCQPWRSALHWKGLSKIGVESRRRTVSCRSRKFPRSILPFHRC
jgi:hypothetical protein